MILIDRRYIRYFDWISFLLILILSGIGLFFVFSATYRPDQPYSIFFKKQTFGIISGLLIYFLCSATDYRSLMRWGYFAFFAIIALLMFTLIKGSVGMGGQRWIDIGFFRIQPSELAKLLFPAYAAYYFYTENDTLSFSMRQFLPVLTVLIISFILILKQPDLGTALVLLFSGLVIVWLAGIGKKFFVYGTIFFLITAPLSWHILKPYQKKRILVFIGQGDSRKERYQIEQSQIAIGSGVFIGKGLLKGTQNKLQFLPESRTDFIFSVVAEEAGFLGALFILILFAILFLQCFLIVSTISSPFIQLLAIGIIAPIIFSTLINIAMVIGLMPIVGIPLPFMSYGLSNLWVNFASLGWFNGIAIRRFYWGQ
jgi:rod shape determining protein RodA